MITQLDFFMLNDTNDILSLLLNNREWLSMSKLSVLSGLNERAVRHEIKRIREDDSIDYVIESSSKGYRIAHGKVNGMMLSRADATLVKATRVQELGAEHTYLKRYLYGHLLDLVENDVVDAAMGDEQKAGIQKKQYMNWKAGTKIKKSGTHESIVMSIAFIGLMLFILVLVLIS